MRRPPTSPPGIGLALGGGSRVWTPAKLAGLLHWSETPVLTPVSGKFPTFTNLAPGGQDGVAIGTNNRPTAFADPMLSGLLVADFDGADDCVKIASVTRPKFVYTVLLRGANQNDYPIWVFYNGVAYCYLAKGNAVGGGMRFYPTGGFTLDPTVSLLDLYYHPVYTEDDGANPRVTILAPDFLTTMGTATVANATTRPTSPGQFSWGAFPDGSLATPDRIALTVATSVVPSAAEIARLNKYAAHKLHVQQLPRSRFVGTRTTLATAQPRPYPPEHEGKSGDSIAQHQVRAVGQWTGTNVGLGQAGDPGAGSRGFVETLCITQGLSNIVFPLMIGTNDSGGVINTAEILRTIQRMFAVGQGRVAGVLLALITERGDSGARQTQIDAANALIPGVVSTAQGLGLPVFLWDTSSFDAGTMTQAADLLHPNTAGAQNLGGSLCDCVVANDFDTGAYLFCPTGDSITEGGADKPGAWASYRPYFAKALAAAGG